MQTQLWLVRHGETDWNRAGIYQGHADVPLNELGREQAAETAAQLASEHARDPFDRLISSPLMRARQTAAVAADRLGMPVCEDPAWMEINQGEWTGKDYRSVVADFAGRTVGLSGTGESALSDSASASLLDNRAPGGESVREVAGRVRCAADRLARLYPGRKILVFSHGLAIATLICHAQGIPLEQVSQRIPGNGAVTMLDWEKTQKAC